MIKTHKPRGHFWTCASRFQQMKEFRDIRYEECIPPPAKIICTDADGRLPSSERAAKRRRIETLANDFLDGQPLLITSARPSANSLKNAVEWNERSRRAHKFSLPQPEVLPDDHRLWADVDDDWAFLKTFTQKSDSRKAPITEAAVSHNPRHDRAQTVTEERAQASCGRVRRQRTVRLTSEPSSVALKQAAALRDRRLRREATEDVAHRTHLPLLRAISEQPSSGLPLVLRPQTRSKPDTASDEWLLRRNTTLYELNADASLDELRCSRDDTPSRRTRSSRSMAAAAQSDHAIDPVHLECIETAADLETDLTSGIPPDHAFINGALSRGQLDLDSPPQLFEVDHNEGGVPVPAVSQEAVMTLSPTKAASYHTAPEETRENSNARPVASDSQSKGDRQARSLERHDVDARTEKSWASSNEALSAAGDAPHFKSIGEHESMSSTASTVRQSTSKSAQQAKKAKQPRRAQSASNSNTTIDVSASEPSQRRRSAPCESQNVAGQLSQLSVDQQRCMGALGTYKAVQCTKDDSTPFMYRKRGVAAKNGAVRRVTKERTPAQADQDEGVHVQDEPSPIPARAPMLDMSFGHDSSFAPGLNMALVDEHLNSRLPADPASLGKTSTLKKALWHELRNSGAEIIRAPGEPASSQSEALSEQGAATPNADTDEASVEDDATEKPRNHTQWPGTQLLLERAQHDLFSSPVKHISASDPSAEMTPQQSDALISNAQTRAENRLEQLPSTQAILDSWSPWSTIKRPTQKYKSAAWAADGCTLRSQPGASVSEHATRRRSSLRFSTSSSRTPAQTGRLQYNVSKSRSSMSCSDPTPAKAPATPKSVVREDSNCSPSLSPLISMPLPEEVATVAQQDLHPTEVPTMSDDNTEPPLPSFQAAQILREDSDPYRMVDEITEFVMGDQDMNGVLSQVSV